VTNQTPGQGQGAPQANPPQQRQFSHVPKSLQAQQAIGANAKAKRRVRNFMLQPLLQVKIGLYSIIMSLIFAAALAWIVYYNFAGLVNSVVLLTDAEDEVRELFMDYWRGTQLWVYLAFVIYLGAVVAMSILYTHKLVGPTIAFRRHIRSLSEGRYNARTYLRKGDAFAEVADELNRLSEMMERSGGVPKQENK
jgi:methyl-accepting chemotaxis protein